MSDASQHNGIKPTIDHYQSIVDRAHAEIEGVRSVYKWLAGSIGAIFATMLIALGILSSNTIEDITGRLDLKASELEQRVEQRIDNQFADKEIQALVEEKAIQRIDQVADKIIATNVDARINPLAKAVEANLENADKSVASLTEKVNLIRHSADAKNSELAKTLDEAKRTLTDLKDQSEFIMTVISAQNDDREAYSKLKTWSNDQSYPMRSSAEAAVFGIQSEYVGFEKPYILQDLKTNIDLRTMSTDVFLANMSSLPLYREAGFLHSIWNNTNIQQQVKLALFQKVLKGESRSLLAANIAARRISDLSNLPLNQPFVFEDLIQWCETNKQANAAEQ